MLFVGYVALGSDCFVLMGMREERKDKGARQAEHRVTNPGHASQQGTSPLWSASLWAGEQGIVVGSQMVRADPAAHSDSYI